MGKLNILHICASHGSQIGGMEQQVISLCNGLAKSELNVHLAASRQLDRQLNGSVHGHLLPTEKSRHHPALRSTLKTVIEHCKPHIIHAHGMKAASLLSSIPRQKGIQYLASIHGDKTNLRTLRGFDACIAVSKEIFLRLQEENLPAHLIENGIPPYDGTIHDKQKICDDLKLDPQLPLLLCAGRLAPVKRYDLVMRACRDLKVNVLLAGEGPMRAELEQLTTERIKLLGHRDDVRGLMHAADALIMASEREGMSLTMLEALASATPVFSSRVSGALSLLPQSSLFSAGTPEHLANFLKHACSDLNTHYTMQVNLFSAVQNEFTQAGMIKRTVALYRQLTRHSEYLFLGDCNTCGVNTLAQPPYPERIGEHLGRHIQNCGHTMATTREAREYFRDFSHPKLSAVFIQYGLVDSWLTLRAAPYVLYYPDNSKRKVLRSWVKKWKKYGRRMGIGALFGMQNQVPIEEYQKNIEHIIQSVECPVMLIETAPNHDQARNAAIEAYNARLHSLADQYAHVSIIPCYDLFSQHMDDYYCDNTHFSDQGHTVLTQCILQTAALSDHREQTRPHL